MILYTLACDAGHRFESWFRDSGTFDDQAAKALVVCPTCASDKVAKTIMAPAVIGGRAVATVPPRAVDPEKPPASDLSEPNDALLDPRSRTMRDLLQSLRAKVLAEAEDVGDRFSDEARRMHDGQAPARQIYGQASIGEARDLLDEGIMVVPLPTLPEDLN